MKSKRRPNTMVVWRSIRSIPTVLPKTQLKLMRINKNIKTVFLCVFYELTVGKHANLLNIVLKALSTCTVKIVQIHVSNTKLRFINYSQSWTTLINV